MKTSCLLFHSFSLQYFLLWHKHIFYLTLSWFLPPSLPPEDTWQCWLGWRGEGVDGFNCGSAPGMQWIEARGGWSSPYNAQFSPHTQDDPAHPSNAPRLRNSALSKDKKSLIPGQSPWLFHRILHLHTPSLQFSTKLKCNTVHPHYTAFIWKKHHCRQKKYILGFPASADSCFTFHLNSKELKKTHLDQPQREFSLHQWKHHHAPQGVCQDRQAPLS